MDFGRKILTFSLIGKSRFIRSRHIRIFTVKVLIMLIMPPCVIKSVCFTTLSWSSLDPNPEQVNYSDSCLAFTIKDRTSKYTVRMSKTDEFIVRSVSKYRLVTVPYGSNPCFVTLFSNNVIALWMNYKISENTMNTKYIRCLY